MMNNEEPELDQSKIPEMMDKAEEACNTCLVKTYLVESGVRFSILNEKLDCLISELHFIKKQIKQQNQLIQWTFILIFASFFTMVVDRIFKFFS